MGLLLYLSYSSRLTDEEKFIVDESVFENRKQFCIFVKNIHYSINGKVQKLIIVISLLTLVNFSGLGQAKVNTIGLPTPPVMRVQPSFRHSSKNPKIAHILALKVDRISYNYFFKSKLLLSIYAIDPRLASNPQISKLMRELRGGSWLGNAAFFAVLYLFYLWTSSEGFVTPYQEPGWGLER